MFDIDGVIAKRMNLFTQISGGVSTEILGNDIRKALEDSEVHSILLKIDSPGGTVDGTQELAQMIYASRGIKPIVSFTNGTMASAAYWFGSASEKIYISGDTTVVGSIGVVAEHIDISRYDEKIGQKITEITSGRFKRIDSSHKPLSRDGFENIKAMVDAIYGAFLDDVVLFRNFNIPTRPDETASKAEEDKYWDAVEVFADGKPFTGEAAITVGLVDGVTTFDQLINTLKDPSKIIRTMVERKVKAIREEIQNAL